MDLPAKKIVRIVGHIQEFVCVAIFFSLLADTNADGCRMTLDGADYVGSQSTTISGYTCQRWDSQHPHEHSRNDAQSYPNAALNEANYCRNPDLQFGIGPWCYTTDPDVRWETCGIQLCPDCLQSPLGLEYRRHRSSTMSGRHCQRWDSQHPHAHYFDSPTNFPSSTNPQNYCRNPDQSPSGPWCFTTDPLVRRESCGLPPCPECKRGAYGLGYMGHKNTTVSGRTCQRWDTMYPHQHIRNDRERHPLAVNNDANYCRNPDWSVGRGPWCYTTDTDVRWEGCGIPDCDEPVISHTGSAHDDNEIEVNEIRDAENETVAGHDSTEPVVTYNPVMIAVLVVGLVIIMAMVVIVIWLVKRSPSQTTKSTGAIEEQPATAPRPLPRRPGQECAIYDEVHYKPDSTTADCPPHSYEALHE